MRSKSTIRNTIINAFGTFLSRISGIVKFNVVNYLFGAGADTFYSANANLLALRKALGEGPLVNSLLPIYSKVKHQEGEDADKFASNILNQILVVALVVTLIGWVSMRFWTKLFLPGFASDPVAFNEIVNLTAVMLLSTFFFSSFSIAMAILNANGRFVVTANAPTISNIIFVVFPILTYQKLGVMSLAWAVVLGTALQAVAGFIDMTAMGFRYRWNSFNVFDARSRNFWKLFLPTSFTYLIQSALSIGLGYFASFLPRGSVTYLRNANTIIQAPVGFIGVALASAVFPLFAGLKHDSQKLFEAWEESLVFFLYLALPIAMLFTLYPDVIVNSIFRDITRLATNSTGKYTPELFQLTIQATGIQGSVLIPWSLNLIINRLFYALERPYMPLIMYAFNFFINIGGYILVRNMNWGGFGLVYADVISGWFTLAISILILHSQMKFSYNKSFLKTLSLLLILSFGAWMIVKPLHMWYISSVANVWMSIILAGAIFLVGTGIFIGSARLLKVDPFIRKIT
ncbi:MAG: murein biosynthesis integral membrane protein MurJ [Brevinema sp.]